MISKDDLFMKTISKELSDLFAYLESGTSVFHVIRHSKEVLEAAGFEELSFQDRWDLKMGGRYFCCPFDTTLYAFTIGKDCDLSEGIHMGCAHTDFPGIKIKPNPEIASHGYLQLNTEVYGGPILNTFFDRPLSLSGKVVTRGERYDQPKVHLVDFKDPILYLPNLAIHMSRDVNEKGAPIDNQRHLLPMLGMLGEELNADTGFSDLLAKKLNVSAEDILDYDLCVYNPQKPQLVGASEEFVSAPRLDDLTSVCALVHGLIDSQNEKRINLVCLFDNEEIGSLSKQGADSSLASVVIGKIWQSFGKSTVDCMADLSAGMLLSMDVAHAYHPSYPAAQDITNYPVLNQGFVLKTASNQSYSWDSELLGSLIDLCRQEDIPCQRFVKHSNTRGGGTIGSIISAHLPMKAADVGVGLLAMHSSCEMMGAKDQRSLARVAQSFFKL